MSNEKNILNFNGKPAGSTTEGMANAFWPILQQMLEEQLSGLEGSRFYDQAKNHSAWNMEVRDTHSAREKYLAVLNMLNDFKSRLSDESYAEDEIFRQAERQEKVGINTALTGSVAQGNGHVSSAGAGAAPFSDPGQMSGSLSDSFFNGLEKVASIGATVGSLFTGAESAVSALSRLSRLDRDLAGKAVGEALGDIPQLAEDLYGQGLGRDQISSQILDILFGSVAGSPGKLQGYSQKQLAMARKSAESYLGPYLSGSKFDTFTNTADSANSSSRLSARVAAHDNAVDFQSGVHQIEGKLFQAQVKCARRLAKLDMRIAQANARAESLKAEYNEKYAGQLDADLAAYRANAENQAAGLHAENQQVVDSLNNQAQRLANQGAALSNEGRVLDNDQKRLLGEILEAEAVPRKLQAQSDAIVAQSQYELVEATSDLFKPHAADPGVRLVENADRWAKHDARERKYKSLRKVSDRKDYRISIPGVASVGGKL